MLRWDLGDETVHGGGFLGLEENLCLSREDPILSFAAWAEAGERGDPSAVSTEL